MHIETVRFDRVFDVQSGHFSFESGGKREYGVLFDGASVPRDGDTFAVALGAPGNWQRVLGWRNLDGAKVVLGRSAWDVASSLVLDFWWFGPALLAAAFVFGGIWAAAVMLPVLLLGAAVILRGVVLHNRKLDRALRAVAPSVPPGPGEGMPFAWRAGLAGSLIKYFSW